MRDNQLLCRGYAAEFFALAENTHDPNRKTTLIDMASAWIDISDHADEVAEIISRRAHRNPANLKEAKASISVGNPELSSPPIFGALVARLPPAAARHY